MRAEAWQALAYLVLAGAAIVGGVWAVIVSRRARRIDAARWLNDLFTTFYRDEKLLAARDFYEYGYWSAVHQAVEIRVTDRHVRLSPAQQVIRSIDLILNLLEQLMYLEREAHIVSRDREAFFAYWFGILEYPSRAGLRRYLARCGYERCAEVVGAEEHEYLALSGPGVRSDHLEPMGEAVLPLTIGETGALRFSKGGECPPLELFKVRDPAVFREMDLQFGYDAHEPDRSRSRRVCLPTIDGKLDVWVYLDPEAYRTLDAVLSEAGGSYRLNMA